MAAASDAKTTNTVRRTKRKHPTSWLLLSDNDTSDSETDDNTYAPSSSSESDDDDAGDEEENEDEDEEEEKELPIPKKQKMKPKLDCYRPVIGLWVDYTRDRYIQSVTNQCFSKEMIELLCFTFYNLYGDAAEVALREQLNTNSWNKQRSKWKPAAASAAAAEDTSLEATYDRKVRDVATRRVCSGFASQLAFSYQSRAADKKSVIPDTKDWLWLIQTFNAFTRSDMTEAFESVMELLPPPPAPEKVSSNKEE